MALKKSTKSAPADDGSAVTKKAKAVAGKKKNGQKRAGTVLGVALPGLVLAMVVVLAVTGVQFFLAESAATRQHEKIVELYRQQLQSTLDAYLAGHEGAVGAVGDAELLPYQYETAETNTLTARYPGAVYARVVPVTIDRSVENGLTYAHQDMVLRIVNGQKVTPEASFYESGSVKEQVVTFVRPVREAGNTVAVLLLSMPFKPLSMALGRVAAEAGTVELVQRIGTEKAVILSAGEGQGVEAASPAITTLRNPGWSLTFAPLKTLGRDAMAGVLVLGLGALAAVLVGVLMFVTLRQLQRKVEEDARAIDSFAENYLRFGNKQQASVNFSASSVAMGGIEQYGAELRVGKPVIRRATDNDGLGDIASADDESAMFGSAKAPAKPSAATPSPAVAPAPVATSAPKSVPAEIFRAYDIRGIVGKGLDEAVARSIGLAIGSEALARGEQVVVVGRDGRLSGPQMNAALIDGLRASGRDVIDVGMVPTPVLYFAAKTIGSGSGVMITGSHNPGDYNGFKIMIAGDTLAGDDIQSLRQRIETGNLAAGAGKLSQQNVAQDYIDRVGGDIVLARPLTVVVDAGNGIAGGIGPRVLEALGCNVIQLFCEVDGKFPNHHPDPSKPENLEDLIGAVAANNADIGIAFDGDGDRIGVITGAGKNIYPDRLMMLLSKHVLMTNPGADIIFDVKCTRDLPALISSHGGRPVMSKTGHSFIKSKLKETGAALAGEMSGHIFFNDRWFGFDDAIYTAGRLLEILSLESGDADAVFAEFPEKPSTPEINIAVPDAKKFALIEAMKAKAVFSDANIITIDGLRVEMPDAWGLVRASNTSPCIVARFEGRTPAALAAVQSRFRTLLASVDSSLEIPF